MAARVASLGIVKIYGPAFGEYLKDGKSNFDAGREFDEKNQEAHNLGTEALESAKDAIDDKLPDGFFCKIEAY